MSGMNYPTRRRSIAPRSTARRLLPYILTGIAAGLAAAMTVVIAAPQ